jgi:hypothetical protein
MTDRCSCGQPAPYHVVIRGHLLHVCGVCYKALVKQPQTAAR